MNMDEIAPEREALNKMREKLRKGIIKEVTCHTCKGKQVVLEWGREWRTCGYCGGSGTVTYRSFSGDFEVFPDGSSRLMGSE